MKFSGAAEGLDYNDEALKDLFNSALDEPLSWWRMRGLDHLTFGEFVEALARSPAKVAGVPQVVGDKAAAPPVAADGAAVPLLAAVRAAAHNGMPRLVRKLEDSPMRSVRAADFPPMKSSPVVLEAIVAITESAPEPTESAPEPAPFREPMLYAPFREPTHSAPFREPTHSAPVREPTDSAPEPAPFREPTESAPEPAPFREPMQSAPEPAPFREPTQSAPEPAPFREPTQSAPEPAPFREPTQSAPEPAPFREPTQSAPEPAPFRELMQSAPEPAPFWEPTQSAPESAPFREPTQSAPFREPTQSAPFRSDQAYRRGIICKLVRAMNRYAVVGEQGVEDWAQHTGQMVKCWGQACFQGGKNQPLKKLCNNGSKSNWAEVIEGSNKKYNKFPKTTQLSRKNMIKTCCHVTRKITLMLQNLGSLELQRLLLSYFKLLDCRLSRLG